MTEKFVEVKGVKKYIEYVFTRVRLIHTDILSVEDNQYKFYLELAKSIKEFANSHRLFSKYMLGKCDYKYVMNMTGYEDARNTFRFLERQRKKFIEYITEKENELFITYPFVGEYKWLHEREVI